MFREKTINIAPFKFNIIIHLTDNLESFLKKYNVDSTNDALGFCILINNSCCVIGLIINTNNGVIVHECSHAVNNLLQKLEYKYSYENDEIPAYLIEYITNETTKFIHKAKLNWTDKKDS